MTANSELFVTEDVRDALVEKYNLPYDIEITVPEAWQDRWDESEFPSSGEADVYHNNKLIGIVRWKVKFFINQEFSKRFVDAAVGKLSFKQVKDAKKLKRVALSYCTECGSPTYCIIRSEKQFQIWLNIHRKEYGDIGVCRDCHPKSGWRRGTREAEQVVDFRK